MDSIALARNGTEKVSAYHTHGADSHGEYWDEIFSGKDEKNNLKVKITISSHFI
ncbi:DUF4329 domain-containing protein [Escherichia coli]